MKPFLIILLSFATLCAFSQEWTQKEAFIGEGRHHAVTFSFDSTAYLLTGSSVNNPYLKDMYRYNARTDEWDQIQDFPGSERSFSIGVTHDGKGYIGFGVNEGGPLNDLWEFDPSNEEWRQLSTCTCLGRTHPALVAIDGKIFVGLGGSEIGNLKDWNEYDIASDSWRPLPDFPSSNRHHPYQFATGGNVYVGFGHGQDSLIPIYKDWYQWDLSLEEWKRVADIPGEARVAGTQFNDDTYGYVLSGDGDDHWTMEVGEFWRYDHQQDEWTELPPHPGVSRWAPASFIIDRTVYFLTGRIHQSGLHPTDVWAYELPIVSDLNERGVISDIEIFPNPNTGTFHIENQPISNVLRTYRIYDGLGRIVFEKQGSEPVKEIEFQQKEGIYYLEIIYDKDKIIQAFEIIHR